MKIVETRFLRGPNPWSTSACFEAVLDLGDRPLTDFPGLTERLCAALPSLDEHGRSCGHAGGFVERVQEGTDMAHLLAHVLLELQCLAGTEVGFGRTRLVEGPPALHRIVVAYRLESLVAAALAVALDAVQALCRGENVDFAPRLERLRGIAARAALDPGARAIVEAADRRGIPHLRACEDASLVQLGWGRQQKRIQATMTSNTSRIAVDLASDRHLTKALLREAGVPVPEGEVVSSAEEAVAAARRIGGAVVLKPLDASRGMGVSTGLGSADEVRAAFERARRLRSPVIVERCLDGAEHRLLIVNGRFVAAARRSPPHVIGDGWRSVSELVEAENRNAQRGDGQGDALSRIPVDDTTHEVLARQGLSLQSIPPSGMRVALRANANLSTGGTVEDVTDCTHPDVAAACVRAAHKIGLDVAGIDVICRDIGRPLQAQDGGIVEVNPAPGIRMHEHPGEGGRHRVGEAILETLYPPDSDGRIPLVAVTGTNGKTTTTLAIAHAMEAAGLVTGVATTEGIRIGDQVVREGDCTGYASARTVLGSPEVDAAVLETAPGGILTHGLGFDRCDVGVVLDVDDDACGQDSMTSIDEIERAERVVVQTATKAAVLNADDARCVAMAPSVDPAVRIIYFSIEPSNRVLIEHLESGGSAVYLRENMAIMAIGGHRIPLIEVGRLGFALHGRARCNVANALAAAAALWACGFDRQRIVAALAAFRSSVERSALRLNVFTAPGVRVIPDYAHNAVAYRALVERRRASMAQH